MIKKLFIYAVYIFFISLKVLIANEIKDLPKNELSLLKSSFEAYQNDNLYWFNRIAFKIPYNKEMRIFLIKINKCNNNPERLPGKYELYLSYEKNKREYTLNYYIIEKNNFSSNEFFSFNVFESNNKYIVEDSKALSKKEYDKIVKNIINKNKLVFQGNLKVEKNFKYSKNYYNIEIINGIKKLIQNDLIKDGAIKINTKLKIGYFVVDRISIFNAIKNYILVFYKRKSRDISRKILVFEKKNKNPESYKYLNHIETSNYVLVFSDEYNPINKIADEKEVIEKMKKNKFFYNKFIKYMYKTRVISQQKELK